MRPPLLRARQLVGAWSAEHRLATVMVDGCQIRSVACLAGLVGRFRRAARCAAVVAAVVPEASLGLGACVVLTCRIPGMTKRIGVLGQVASSPAH